MLSFSLLFRKPINCLIEIITLNINRNKYLNLKKGFWLLYLLLMISFYSSANEEIKVVTELFFPYQQLDENNQLTGYSVDIVNTLAKHNNDTLDIELLPWSVAYRKALSNPNLMIFLIGKNPQRAPFFEWIGPVATERLHFWALSSRGIDYSEKVSDFKQYEFAVIKDGITHQFLSQRGFERIYEMRAIDSNASEESRINMLLKSRADIVISTPPTIKAALIALNLPEDLLVSVHQAKALDTDLYFAFNKNSNPKITSAYKQAMKKLVDSGEIKKLKQKWSIQ